MDLVYLFIGIVLGFVIGWFIVKSKLQKSAGLPLSELEEKYVPKSLFINQQKSNEEKEDQILMLTTRLAQAETQLKNWEQKNVENQKQLQDIQSQFKIEFKNLSNDILEEKSKRFLEMNEKNVGELLNPLKEKIMAFEKKVDDNYKEETRERFSLKKELEIIVKLNQQVSDDASRLTNALRGDKKIQGDWGEVQLELILEKAGLLKGIHYQTQVNYKDEQGRNQRPDCIIHLPDNKNLILDSKVSLVAYERYFNADDVLEQTQFLQVHVNNIKKHISDLSAKNYQKLYEINAPDYVIMFVPIEPALTTALKSESGLFDQALSKNIVLVSTSTLLATLRTISHIWKQEDQRRNVVEIARQSGALYDKFVGFTEDLLNVGKKLDDSKSAYTDALNKLFESKKKGDTIIGRMERLKTLGADASKQIPNSLLNQIEE